MDHQKAYESLHNTPAQAKFRRMKPWPVGAVFVQWPDMTEEDIRKEFRKMKEVGFTCLKQACSIYDEDRKWLMKIALEEGIIPWWYEEAGWEDPTPELAVELGLPADTPPEAIMEYETYRARQMAIMLERIEREGEKPPMAPTAEIEEIPGTIKKHEFGLPKELSARFTAWLKDKYGTVEELKKGWNFNHYGVRRMDAETWEEVEDQVIDFVNHERCEYNRMMDVVRFKSELYLRKLKQDIDRNMLADPHRPLRAGGEMSLFLPTPLLSADMEKIADLMADAGSYYPSMHLAWHFEETDFEFVRPIYMQSALAADYMKNAWAATWESTGGPQQFTGGSGVWWPETIRKTPSFTVDGSTMRQIMLSWMAAGFKGFGIWTWNARTVGWEGGEYGLTDKDGQLNERAIAAGAIGKACKRYKGELWEADKKPVVGVYVDWENEALWTAMSIGGREHFRSQGILARIGLCRTLINAGIPFEFVTPSQLRAGLASRYQMIYLTGALMVQTDMIDILADYAKAGGRVVLDAPGGLFEEHARVLFSNEGTPFEQLFGARLANLQSSTERHPWKVDGYTFKGTTFDIVPTGATVKKRFEDGKVAVSVNKVGEGEAVLCAWSGGLCTHPEASETAQRLLTRYVLDDLHVDFRCEGAIVYRLDTPDAEHYFLINDGEASRAVLQPACAGSAMDAITGEAIAKLDNIEIPAHDARWIRIQK